MKGAKEGQGKYRYADGKYYEGAWVQNKMEGYGEMHWDELELQEEGKDKLNDKNYEGEYYKGQWANNQRTGDGT